MFRIVDSVAKLEKPGDWYDYELTILGIPIKPDPSIRPARADGPLRH